MSDQRSDAASEVAPAPDLRVDVQIEGSGPWRIFRLRPLAARTGDSRPRDRGPFASPLWAELHAVAAARSRITGYGGPLGRIGGSWADASFVVPHADLMVVQAAVRALLDGDEQPLRGYFRSPPQLPHGEPWSAPQEGEGWATR